MGQDLASTLADKVPKKETRNGPRPGVKLMEIFYKAVEEPKKAEVLLSGDLKIDDNPLGFLHDLDAIQGFIIQTSDSVNTQRRYQLDVERALLWMLIELRKPLSSARKEDFYAYGEFLAGETKTDREWFWRGPRKPKYLDDEETIPNPEWRPFSEEPMSAKSRDHVLSVLASALSWMNHQEYLSINVLHKLRKRTKDPSKLNQTVADKSRGFLYHAPNETESDVISIDDLTFKQKDKDPYKDVTFELPGVQRFIPQPVWNEVISYIENLPLETEGQVRRFHQLRWLIMGMYCTGARIHEFCSHPMRSLVKDQQGRLFWSVIGKGSDPDTVPVLEPLPEILEEYRNFLGLPVEIGVKENTRLALGRRGKKPINKRQVFEHIKKLFQTVAEESDYLETKQVLEKASPHWIRHSVITHLLEKGIPIEQVQLFARHSTREMTEKYFHVLYAKQHDRLNSKNV